MKSERHIKVDIYNYQNQQNLGKLTLLTIHYLKSKQMKFFWKYIVRLFVNSWYFKCRKVIKLTNFFNKFLKQQSLDVINEITSKGLFWCLSNRRRRRLTLPMVIKNKFVSVAIFVRNSKSMNEPLKFFQKSISCSVKKFTENSTEFLTTKSNSTS